MMSPDQRMLLGEIKEFMASVQDGAWTGRPEWRAVLTSRIDTALAADAEQEAMIGGIRGALTRWLNRGK